MIRTLMRQIGEYRRASLLTPLYTGLEVLMEVLIPFVTASIIDKGIEAGDIGQVYAYGGLMLGMAFLSLVFGALAGRYAAKASAGFACNLGRPSMKTFRHFPSPTSTNTARPGW